MRRPWLLAFFAAALACGELSSALGVAYAESAGPLIVQDDEEDEHVLDIPGLGRIPMPPNVRVFGPRSRAAPVEPRVEAPPPPPKPAPSEEQRRAQTREELFARLAKAETDEEAQAVGAALLRDWSRSNSETVQLLSTRAAAAEAGGAHDTALALLRHVVTLAPYWAEGFVLRAGVKAAAGDEAGALADLETAVQLEPRRFDALAALGVLAEKLGEKKHALDAYRKSLAISPRQDTLRKNEERLRIEVEGRDI